MHSFFLWSFTLCTIIICKSSNIAFFVHISLISFCFQRCYFTKIQCMFFLPSTSWRWLGGSKWEAIIWSAAVENGDHDDEGHSLLGFKRGRWKMIPLIVRPNPKLQFDTTHNQKFSWWSFQDVSKITDRVEL